MNLITINEIFSGFNNVIIPDKVDGNALVEPMPFCYGAHAKALLYISEKVNSSIEINLSTLKEDAAYAVVVSNTLEVKSCALPIIRVENVRRAFAYAISRLHRIDFGKLKFIGVTGTNGKTTTATLIYEMLSRCGYRVGFIGTGKILSTGKLLTSDTYSMTTPDPTVLYPAIKRMCEDECEYVVMEVSSHSIALGKVEPIRFEYAIFTNLDDEHLDFHSSKEEYFKTKLQLFSKTKIGLFNLDDEYGQRAFEVAECQKTTFGIINQGNAYATDIELSSLVRTTFYYRETDLIFKAETHLFGAFNVYNALAALKCVIDLGVKPCVAKATLCEIRGVGGRMELIKGDITAVIDYAHTPMAFYNCLKTLKNLVNTKQSLITVFGCGGDRDKGKRPLFGKWADLFADKVIITEDNSRSESFDAIASDIVKGIEKRDYEIIKDRESAIRHAFKIAKSGDIIALIGKGHERYKIIENEYFSFDERNIIRDEMKKRKGNYESQT